MARTTGTHTKAWGTLVATGDLADGDTFTCGTITYRAKTTPAAANDFKRGTSLTNTLSNAALLINGTGVGDATDYYGTGSTTVAAVIATSNTTTLTLTARLGGSHANGIRLAEGTDGGTAFSITRAISGGAGALHTLISDLHGNGNNPNSEIIMELSHIQNAANGA